MGKVEELVELKKGILAPEQVAEILELSVHTLEKWRTSGRYNLPYLKIGRNVRYRAEDVAAFLEPNREASQKVQPSRRRRRARKPA